MNPKWRSRYILSLIVVNLAINYRMTKCNTASGNKGPGPQLHGNGKLYL